MSVAMPSHSLEAEESVIGGILVHAPKLHEVIPIVKSAGDFDHPALRAIYEAMLELDAASKPVDALTVLEQMRASDTVDKLNAFNGADYLTDLMAKVVTAENIGYHAKLVRDKAAARRLLEVARQMHGAVHSGEDPAGVAEVFSRRLLDCAQEATNEASAVPLTMPIAEFLGDEAEADTPERFLVDEMLPEGCVCFWAGAPKTLKTYAALLIAICVAQGRKFLDRFACRQSAVVYIAEEDTQQQMRRRLWWLARGLRIDPRALPIRISAMRGFRVDDEDRFAQLKAEGNGAGLIVLDALTRVHGLDENSRTDMQRVTLALTELATSTGATVLALHHYKKPGEGDNEKRPGHLMRGTGDLYALARAIVGVEKADDGVLTIKRESNYLGPVEPFAMRMQITPPPEQPLAPGQHRSATFEYLGAASTAKDTALDVKVLAKLAEQDRPQSGAEIEALMGGNAPAVRASIKRLAQDGRIERVEAEKERANGTMTTFQGWRARAT
jgi:hypothetical protein